MNLIKLKNVTYHAHTIAGVSIKKNTNNETIMCVHMVNRSIPGQPKSFVVDCDYNKKELMKIIDCLIKHD